MANLMKKPRYYIHENGFIMSYGFPVENFKSALRYVPDPGDVFICTYPKCGTTWTQCILYHMLSKGKPLEPGQNINEFIPHLEEVGKDVICTLPKPRVIKTHLPFDLIPWSKDAKYICVARNPKDCCVSFYYHTKGFYKYYRFEDGRFDDYFELFLEGKVDFGDYFDHLLSWIAHKDKPNVMFMLYEEMKTDIKGCIRKMEQFLGEPFFHSCKDESILNLIIDKSSFHNMKATPECWSSKQTEGSPGFIRKGEIGDWRRYFSEEQTKRMDEKFRIKLSETDAEHLWDDYDC